jgi:hypothetical protein
MAYWPLPYSKPESPKCTCSASVSKEPAARNARVN